MFEHGIGLITGAFFLIVTELILATTVLLRPVREFHVKPSLPWLSINIWRWSQFIFPAHLGTLTFYILQLCYHWLHRSYLNTNYKFLPQTQTCLKQRTHICNSLLSTPPPAAVCEHWRAGLGLRTGFFIQRPSLGLLRVWKFPKLTSKLNLSFSFWATTHNN